MNAESINVGLDWAHFLSAILRVHVDQVILVDQKNVGKPGTMRHKSDIKLYSLAINLKDRMKLFMSIYDLVNRNQNKIKFCFTSYSMH